MLILFQDNRVLSRDYSQNIFKEIFRMVKNMLVTNSTFKPIFTILIIIRHCENGQK